MAEGRARILIVDDNDAQRYSLHRPLLLADHECHEATAGLEALAKVRELRPELVILDVRLPDLSGFDVCRQLKADPVTASTLVLLVSAAETAPESKVYGLQGGADGYLVTPIHPRELVATVGALLRLRRAEAQRDDLGRQLLDVLTGMSSGFVSLGAEGRVAFVNPVAERLLGRTRAELVGQPLPTGDGFVLGRLLHRHARAAEETRAELRFEDPDPQHDRWFAGRAVPAPHGVTLFFDDVTPRKRAERALVESEQRLRLATDVTGVGIWDYRPLTGELEWDPHVRALFGLGEADAVSYDTFVAQVHPEDRARVDLAVKAAMAAPDHPVYDVEFRAIGRHDGVTRWVGSRGRVFHDEAGRPVRMLGTAMDIAPAKAREQQMRRVAEYAEQLVAIVGHDLRNPLAAAQVSAELISREPGISAHTRKHIEQIERSTGRATRLTRQILDLTQARLGGGLRLERGAHALNQTVGRVAEEIRAAHPEIQLVLALDARPDTGVWDDPRLSQALVNVVSNALTHGAPGSPVRVTTRTTDDAFEISVHNEGPAIPPAVLPTLFEPFHPGREGREEGSLGLGLYIVDQILRAHGGSVTIDSDAGRGTTCVLRLPRR